MHADLLLVLIIFIAFLSLLVSIGLCLKQFFWRRNDVDVGDGGGGDDDDADGGGGDGDGGGGDRGAKIKTT